MASASAIASEGTLRIHRSIAGTSAPFRVTYQAYQDGDEPAPAAEADFLHRSWAVPLAGPPNRAAARVVS